jgi:hypothetical protein
MKDLAFQKLFPRNGRNRRALQGLALVAISWGWAMQGGLSEARNGQLQGLVSDAVL